MAYQASKILCLSSLAVRGGTPEFRGSGSFESSCDVEVWLVRLERRPPDDPGPIAARAPPQDFHGLMSVRREDWVPEQTKSSKSRGAIDVQNGARTLPLHERDELPQITLAVSPTVSGPGGFRLRTRSR